MRTRIGITVGLLALAMVPASGFQRPPTDEEKEAVRVRIGISKDQQAQIEAAWAENRRQSEELSKKMNDLRRQLYGLYENYDYDRAQADGLRHQTQVLYRKRLEVFGQTQEKMRKILSRDQFNRLQAIMREQREKMRRDWESRRGPGGPGRGPGGLRGD